MKLIKTFSILVTLLSQSACSSLGLTVLNTTARLEASHSRTTSLAYGNKSWQQLDVYVPTVSAKERETTQKQPRPVILFLYGGGWETGKRAEYLFAAAAFTKRGYVVVIPDYIKYPKGKFPSFMWDIAKSVAWTKNNIGRYGGNPQQLNIVGHSAGAHMGALLLADSQYLNSVSLQPASISAFAGMAGPYNFTPRKMPYTDIFGPPSNFQNMIVLNFIDGDEPPMLLLHGLKDETVGVLNKDSLVKTVKQSGGRVEHISYPDASHVGILLGLHSLFDGNIDPANDIDTFFKAQSSQSKDTYSFDSDVAPTAK